MFLIFFIKLMGASLPVRKRQSSRFHSGCHLAASPTQSTTLQNHSLSGSIYPQMSTLFAHVSLLIHFTLIHRHDINGTYSRESLLRSTNTTNSENIGIFLIIIAVSCHFLLNFFIFSMAVQDRERLWKCSWKTFPHKW